MLRQSRNAIDENGRRTFIFESLEIDEAGMEANRVFEGPEGEQLTAVGPKKFVSPLGHLYRLAD